MAKDAGTDGPGAELARLLRDARHLNGWTQYDVERESGVSRQTYIRYESGNSANARPNELRAVCLALGIDPRLAAVAIGLVTREEFDLPPADPPVDTEVLKVIRILADPNIPDEAKGLLLRGIGHAVDLWFDAYRYQPPIEPSAAERTPARRRGDDEEPARNS